MGLDYRKTIGMTGLNGTNTNTKYLNLRKRPRFTMTARRDREELSFVEKDESFARSTKMGTSSYLLPRRK